jgi:four helix bundle protein
MAQGSLTELKNFLLIAKDINYLNTNDFNVLMEQANVTHQLLQGFIKKSKTFINHESKIINRV